MMHINFVRVSQETTLVAAHCGSTMATLHQVCALFIEHMKVGQKVWKQKETGH